MKVGGVFFCQKKKQGLNVLKSSPRCSNLIGSRQLAAPTFGHFGPVRSCIGYCCIHVESWTQLLLRSCCQWVSGDRIPPTIRYGVHDFSDSSSIIDPEYLESP